MQLKPSQTPLAGRGRLDSGLHDTRRVPTDRAQHDREPHQQAFLLPTYLLLSLSRLAEAFS
jgi:hypothetical protein